MKAHARATSAVVLAGMLAIAGLAPSAVARRAPSTERVAFARIFGTKSAAMTMRVDGKKVRTARKVNAGFPSGIYSARLSPDGKRLLFVVVDVTGPKATIWTSKANGKRARKIVETSGGKLAVSPSWSPDGKRIVYTELNVVLLGSRIMTAKASGKGKRQVRKFKGGAIAPSFSPDGSLIVFTHSRQNAGTRIRTMKASGKRLRTLTKKGVISVVGGFSPDGERISFVRMPLPASRSVSPSGLAAAHRGWPGLGRGPEPEPTFGDVFTMDTRGKAVRRLSKGKSAVTGGLYTADGKRLLVTRFTNSSQSGNLFSIPVEGGKWKRLTKTNQVYNIFDFFAMAAL